MNQQEKTKFDDMLFQSLKSGGLHVIANKSHGKSRLLFSMASKLGEQGNVRVLIFDGSETWLYCYNKIEIFSIGEHDIVTSDVKTTQEMERFTLRNWQLVKMALDGNKDLLFRLKTRSPSKRGFFVRTVVNYLDALQREEKTKTENHESTKAIAYFIEEAQDCFNSRSSARIDAEEFLTVFNEARNQKEAFFTASQRLTDFSKTIRSKQLYCIGKMSSEDITPALRRLEKKHNVSFENMPSRQWFFDGETFTSPEWTQQGKPFQINRAIKLKWLESLPKPKPLKVRIFEWLTKPRPSNVHRMLEIQRQKRIEANPALATQEQIEFPEEQDHYQDSTDSDLVEFDLDED